MNDDIWHGTLSRLSWRPEQGISGQQFRTGENIQQSDHLPVRGPNHIRKTEGQMLNHVVGRK